MVVFLDANSVIYAVEQPPVWGPRVVARLTALEAAGESFAVTELVRMECLVGPTKAGDAPRLAEFAAFFSAPNLVVLPITTAVAQRAATLRAIQMFQPLDALHLAAAIEHGCGIFLTNDVKLAKCPGVAVEVLT